MEHLDPYISNELYILSIDPGIGFLGYTISNVINSKLNIVITETIDVTSIAKLYKTITEVHGLRIAKLMAIEDMFYDILRRFKPHFVVVESPYMGKFPNAYAALIECLNSIRRATIKYDVCLKMYLIDPPTIKSSIGVNGRSSDKQLLTIALNRLADMGKIFTPVDLNLLDEHSIDSIAIALAFLKNMNLMEY